MLCRWVHLYTHHLQEKVVNSISELYSFMNHSNDTLDLKVLGEVSVSFIVGKKLSFYD